MIQKSEVHYEPVPRCKIEIGLPAVVVAMDHPSHLVSAGEVVRTTKVQAYDEATGIFETRNTIYKPC